MKSFQMSNTNPRLLCILVPDMNLPMRWYHETKSQNFLKIILFFSTMFWIFRIGITIPFHHWPWIALCFSIVLMCLFGTYRASRTMQTREAGGFLFLLWACNGFPIYMLDDLKNHQYISSVLFLPCYIMAVYSIFRITTGQESYLPREQRAASPRVTASEVCLGMSGLFLTLAYMVNGGFDLTKYPIRINSLSSDYTLAFLTVSGMLALYPVSVSTHGILIGYFGRRKREQL